MIAVSAGMWLGLSSGKAPDVAQEIQDTLFERAVDMIKKYETINKPSHWPYVGYGHLVMPGEKFSRSKALSEAEADALLRKDLLKNCAVFRSYGADSLLLGVLAYNIGSGNVKKSTVAKLLREGNRDIAASYLAHCRYRGKQHASLRKRRAEELDKLFITDALLHTFMPADTIGEEMDTVAVVSDNDTINNEDKLSNPGNDE